MNLNLTLSRRAWMAMAVLYLYSGIFLFFSSWLQPWAAILLVSVCLVVGWRFFHSAAMLRIEKKPPLTISWMEIAVLVGVVLFVGWLCGWNGFTEQPIDWDKHNAVLRDLIDYSWPVTYSNGQPAMLCYYIGQYLLPALFGKITHSFLAALWCEYVYNALGLLLAFFGMFQFCQADSIWKRAACVAGMLLFAGTLTLAQMSAGLLSGDGLFSQVAPHWYDPDGMQLQFRSILIALRWVFPQCLTCYLSCLLFAQLKSDVGWYVFILMPVLLYGTFSFLGLVMMAVLQCVNECFVSSDKGRFFKNMFGADNLLMCLPALCLTAYLAGNIFGSKPDVFGASVQDFSGNGFWLFLNFYVMNVGLYFVCLLASGQKEFLLFNVMICLFFIPWMRMGFYNDWCMCVSIPCMFVLMLFCWKFLLEKTPPKPSVKAAKIVLCLLLAVAAIEPIREVQDIVRTDRPGTQISDVSHTLAFYTENWMQPESLSDPYTYNYFSYNWQQTFFGRWLARK